MLPKACWHRVYNSQGIKKKKKESIIHPEMSNKTDVLHILNGIWLSQEREENYVISSRMSEQGKDHTKSS